MESQAPPPPPPIKDGKMAKWLVFGLRAASSLIWGCGPLLFDGGEGESGKFSHANIYFFIWMRLVLQTSVCVRFPVNTLIFLLHFFSVYSLPKQFGLNSPSPVKKTMVRPLERCIPLNLRNCIVFEI